MVCELPSLAPFRATAAITRTYSHSVQHSEQFAASRTRRISLPSRIVMVDVEVVSTATSSTKDTTTSFAVVPQPLRVTPGVHRQFLVQAPRLVEVPVEVQRLPWLSVEVVEDGSKLPSLSKGRSTASMSTASSLGSDGELTDMEELVLSSYDNLLCTPFAAESSPFDDLAYSSDEDETPQFQSINDSYSDSHCSSCEVIDVTSLSETEEHPMFASVDTLKFCRCLDVDAGMCCDSANEDPLVAAMAGLMIGNDQGLNLQSPCGFVVSVGRAPISVVAPSNHATVEAKRVVPLLDVNTSPQMKS